MKLNIRDMGKPFVRVAFRYPDGTEKSTCVNTALYGEYEPKVKDAEKCLITASPCNGRGVVCGPETVLHRPPVEDAYKEVEVPKVPTEDETTGPSGLRLETDPAEMPKVPTEDKDPREPESELHRSHLEPEVESD